MSKIFPEKLGRVRMAGLLWFAVAASAFGQVAPVTGGHALDANPQVGGKGTDGRAQTYAPVNGNDIITGNVTGLGYFHGNIPYSSPFQFHANLPSNSLGGFTRASAGGAGQPTYLGQMRSFYTPSSLVSTNSGRVNQGMALSVLGNHMESSLTGPGSINPTVAAGAGSASSTRVSSIAYSEIPILQDYRRLSSQRMVPGVDQTENDMLFGLRRSLETAPVNATTLQPETPDNNNGTLAPNANSAGTPGMPGAKPGTPDDLDNPDALDEKPKDLASRAQVNDRIRDKPVRSALATPRLSTTPGEFPDVLGKFKPIRVSAPFEDQLATLEYNPKAMTAEELAGGTSTNGVPDNTRFSLTSKKTAADAKKKAAARVVIGVTGPTDQPTPLRDKGGTIGGMAPSATQPGEAAVLAPGPAPGSGTVIPAVEYLSRAASELKNGQYLQAADSYQAALRVEPGNSAALLGRAHAEFAGGLYESAVFDLKYFFNIEPKKMADQYNLVTLFTGKRVDFLERDLLTLQQKNPRTPADFLLAYLYFQTGRPEELKSTLDRWGKQAPDDPWPVELRKEWAPDKAAATQGGG